MDTNDSAFAKGILTILFSWIILGALLTRSAAAIIPREYLYRSFILMNLPQVALLFGILLTLRYILLTDLRSFIVTADRPRPRRSMLIALLWVTLFAASHLVTASISRETLIYRDDFSSWLSALPLILLITPVQTTAEELLFRTYLGRWAQARGLGRTITIILSGLLFLSVHLLNPEILHYGDDPFIFIYYAVFGSCMMALALQAGSYEIPIVIHMVNNLYTLLLVNYEGSVLETPSLFFERQASPLQSTVVVLLGTFLTLILVRRRSGSQD
jgi:uncharacterized protein